ncbi:12261_t:CDS:2 [Gigaspora rosea]|nr:12261_t:CDS:2 [Gigaspora rosea]
MDCFLDVDNNNEHNGPEGRENDFQQQIRQLETGRLGRTAIIQHEIIIEGVKVAG